MRLRLGTRGSKLAMVQAESVQSSLAQAGWDVEVCKVTTSGDRGERDRLGAFVHEIQRALLDNEVDLALHCLKDVPTTSVAGLRLMAHMTRDDSRDTVILREGTLMGLPSGSVVGTGSLRRTSQLRAMRSDLLYKPLVGNVDTRLRKLREGEYDAILLAVAGLDRLGIDSENLGMVVEPLDVERFVPAAGQGVLVLEGRIGDDRAAQAAAFLHDPRSEAESTSERSFLAQFGSGCSLPVAAHARLMGEAVTLHGRVVSMDGSLTLDSHKTGREPLDLGQRMAEELIAKGALDLLPEEARA